MRTPTRCPSCRATTDAHDQTRIERRRRPPRVAQAAIALLVLTVTSLGVAAASVHAAVVAPATVMAFNTQFLGAPPATTPAVVGVAAVASGYYVLRANGVVDAFGVPAIKASTVEALPVGSTATGIAVDPATGGYWTVSSNGTVDAVNAPFLGQPRIPSGGWGQYPAAVAIAAAPGGSGYYVLRANGVVDAFGATLRGSSAGRLPYGSIAPVVAVALAVDPTTGGYWIATSDGNVVAFNAPDYGPALVGLRVKYGSAPITGLAAAPGGSGYYVLRANGVVDAFGTVDRTAPTPTSLPGGAVASALALDPRTGGYYVGIDLTAHGGYLNPLRAVSALVPQEIDQGVDYCGSGPIYALGDAIVVTLYDPGWPSGVFISYRLLSGPAKGHYVYAAENVTPLVRIGQHVTATTVLGIIHDAKTCLETGWAAPPGPPQRAAAYLYYTGRNSTAFGLNFSTLLESLGARPGLPQPNGSPGPLPPGWPTW